MSKDVASSLISCIEEQRLANSYQQEREQLLKLGIKTASSLDTAIVFRGLQDILVAVNRKSGDVILCSASVEKLSELVRLNCVIPRGGDFMYEQELLTSNLQYSTINDYIQKGKYHFVKLIPYRKVSSCFLCQFSAFKPYPNFEGYEVYTLSAFSAWFNSIEQTLSKGYVTVSFLSGSADLVCTRLPKASGGNALLSVPCLYCKLYAHDLSDAFVQISVFDIKDIQPYYASEFERSINEGIVRIGGKNYTSNREILEMYYGGEYYLLETQKVKERWALEDILSRKITTLEQVMSKYRFDTNIGFPLIKDFNALVDYLVQSIDDRAKGEPDKVTVRVLASVGLIKTNKVSFYRTVKLNSIPEYTVVPFDEVLPSQVVIAGVSKDYGYQVSYAKVGAGCNVKEVCIKEFKRQFGSLCGSLEVYKTPSDGCPLDISLKLQRKLAESINAGDYVCNFKDYYKVLVEIMNANNVPWCNEVSVQHLFINNLVRALKEDFKKKNLCERAYIRDFSVFSVELCKYIRLVQGMSEVKHKGYLVNHVRQYSSYDKGLKQEIRKAIDQGKDTEGILGGKLPFKIILSKKVVLVTLSEIGHSISVSWSENSDKSLVLADKYESVRKV